MQSKNLSGFLKYDLIKGGDYKAGQDCIRDYHNERAKKQRFPAVFFLLTRVWPTKLVRLSRFFGCLKMP